MIALVILPGLFMRLALVSLPALLAGFAVTAGARRLNIRMAVGGVIAAAIVMGLWIAAQRVSGVHQSAVIEGVLVGSVLIAALPLLTYYVMGRILFNHRIVLGVLWAGSLVPLYYYLFIAWLGSAGVVACPPGSYECPV